MAGRFNLEEYVTVEDRIQKFWELYPNGSIQTKLVSEQGGAVTFVARVYRAPDDQRPVTGYAAESVEEDFAVEKAETSAIGRALANMGFKTRPDEPRPSREEMERVNRRQEQRPPAAPANRTKPGREDPSQILDREKTFGKKYRGMKWRDIIREDPDHVQWAVENADLLTADEREVLRSELERRAAMTPFDAEVGDQDDDLPF